MATFKKSVDFMPRLTKEEKEEKFKLSRAAIYAAVLPLLASFIWVIAMFINSYYAGQVKNTEATIQQRKDEIASYDNIRKKHTELVLKIENLQELVIRDFFPQKFFDVVSDTIRSTGDAQASIYAYGREESGTFNIKGKANSYLDLAKIMVVFNSKKEFYSVEIRSIHYDEEKDEVNFEIIFEYIEESPEEEMNTEV